MSLKPDVPPLVPNRQNILLVEDEALVRMVLADDLRAAGFVVIECASGDEAFGLLASGIDFDLLFTDVQMPGRIDGLALAREVRALRPTIPILVASARIRPGSAENYDAFLPKPFAFEAALRYIHHMLCSKEHV